jgi:hypothetical protein
VAGTLTFSKPKSTSKVFGYEAGLDCPRKGAELLEMQTMLLAINDKAVLSTNSS